MNMDEVALALMARMDNIRDDVTDIRLHVIEAHDTLERHEERLVRLEDITGSTKNILESISEDLKEIKTGPVYSLDRFIPKRVAQVTGGMGLIGLFIWSIAAGIL